MMMIPCGKHKKVESLLVTEHKSQKHRKQINNAWFCGPGSGNEIRMPKISRPHQQEGDQKQEG